MTEISDRLLSRLTALPKREAATALGLIAIVLWACLAALTLAAGPIPAFQLVAMCFALPAIPGLAFLARRKQARQGVIAIPAGALALGVGGLFGYHFFYFLSLNSAPPLQANLINYLWPLLIVLFSGLLPQAGERLQWRHVAGCLMALSGAFLLLFDQSAAPFRSEAWLGYGAALLAAIVWAAYSVLLRLYRHVSSAAVILACAITSVLAGAAHLAFETTLWPLTQTQMLAVLALGLGPVGAAFYVWDYGCKHGNIKLLGTAAYATPLLSTGLLSALGTGDAGAVIWLAAVLISCGALVTISGRPNREPAGSA